MDFRHSVVKPRGSRGIEKVTDLFGTIRSHDLSFERRDACKNDRVKQKMA
jgi:hypothetical protein